MKFDLLMGILATFLEYSALVSQHLLLRIYRDHSHKSHFTNILFQMICRHTSFDQFYADLTTYMMH